MKRGDIYLVDLGDNCMGSEHKGVKYVLVVSNDTGNKYSKTFISSAITSSQTKVKLPTHVRLSDYEFLDKSSLVLLEQVRTLDKSRIKRYVGHISSRDLKAVDLALGVSVNLLTKKSRIALEKAYEIKAMLGLLNRLATDNNTVSSIMFQEGVCEVECRIKELRQLCESNKLEFFYYRNLYQESGGLQVLKRLDINTKNKIRGYNIVGDYDKAIDELLILYDGNSYHRANDKWFILYQLAWTYHVKGTDEIASRYMKELLSNTFIFTEDNKVVKQKTQCLNLEIHKSGYSDERLLEEYINLYKTMDYLEDTDEFKLTTVANILILNKDLGKLEKVYDKCKTLGYDLTSDNILTQIKELQKELPKS